MAITTYGRQSLEVAQRKLEASVFWVIIVADGESDVDGITCKKLMLLHSFRHVPAEGIEGDSGSEVSSHFSVLSCH